MEPRSAQYDCPLGLLLSFEKRDVHGVFIVMDEGRVCGFDIHGDPVVGRGGMHGDQHLVRNLYGNVDIGAVKGGVMKIL